MWFDSRLPTVDLFAGAGGLSLGLAAAGFGVVAAAECDEDSCDTFQKHHPAAEIIRGDLASPSTRERLAAFRGRARVVAGGPPCQPWSSGGKRLGEVDRRNGFPLFCQAVALLGPGVEAFIMENVTGVLRGRRGQEYWAHVASLEAMGFTVRVEEVNAADFGVPQRRRRVVAVGMRGRAFEFPDGDFGPGHARPWQPAGTVISPGRVVGEPNRAIVSYARNPDIRPDPYDGQVFNGGGRPIDLSRPAPTLLASMGGNKTPWIDTLGIVPDYHTSLIAGGEARAGHVPGARRITVTEAALLQTFRVPDLDGCDGCDAIEFAGKRSSQYRQIGNAVPPRLAEAIGAALAEQLGI